MNIFRNPTLQTFMPPSQFWIFLILGFKTFFFVFHHTSLPQKPSPLCSSKKIWMAWLCQRWTHLTLAPFLLHISYDFSLLLPFPPFFICSIYSPLFLGTIVVRMTFWSLELQNNSTSMVRFFLRVFCACLLLVPSSKIC
jgi:hypothetical protein